MGTPFWRRGRRRVLFGEEPRPFEAVWRLMAALALGAMLLQGLAVWLAASRPLPPPAGPFAPAPIERR